MLIKINVLQSCLLQLMIISNHLDKDLKWTSYVGQKVF